MLVGSIRKTRAQGTAGPSVAGAVLCEALRLLIYAGLWRSLCVLTRKRSSLPKAPVRGQIERRKATGRREWRQCAFELSWTEAVTTRQIPANGPAQAHV